MDTYDEWYYTMLLDMLKQKDKDKHEAQYKQIELELPLPLEHRPEVKEEQKEENRGVVILDM